MNFLHHHGWVIIKRNENFMANRFKFKVSLTSTSTLLLLVNIYFDCVIFSECVCGLNDKWKVYLSNKKKEFANIDSEKKIVLWIHVLRIIQYFQLSLIRLLWLPQTQSAQSACVCKGVNQMVHPIRITVTVCVSQLFWTSFPPIVMYLR